VSGVAHAEWIAERSPAAPEALVRCMCDTFRQHPEWDALPRAEALVAAGEALLRQVLEGDASSRASALSLLAADACVTYAFEAAADEPQTIAARAQAAAMRIGNLARSANGG